MFSTNIGKEGTMDLKPEFFSHNDDMEIYHGWSFVQDAGDVADAGRALTVHAHTGNGTGVGPVKAFVVDGGCIHFDALHGCIQVGDDFIHTDNYDDLLRAKAHGSDTVAGTVGVDELTIQGYCVGSRDEDVAQ